MIIQVIQDVFTQIWGEPYLPQAVIIGLIMLLIQWAKSMGLPKQFAPLVSVLAAVVLSILNGFLQGVPIAGMIAPGIVIGLVASGSFSAIKSIGKGIAPPQ